MQNVSHIVNAVAVAAAVVPFQCTTTTTFSHLD